jgi:hypothetical protein
VIRAPEHAETRLTAATGAAVMMDISLVPDSVLAGRFEPLSGWGHDGPGSGGRVVSAKISHLPPSIIPRGLNVDQAAEYVGVSAPKFIDAVKAARYPEPIRHGKRQVWDLRALDLAMDRESGIANPMAVGAEDAIDHDAITLRSNIAKRRVGNARTR